MEQHGIAAMICDSCRLALFTDSLPSCPRCGVTVGLGLPAAADCINCEGRDFAFDSVIRVGPYENLLRNAVLRMKHLQGEMLAETLGGVWAETMKQRLDRLNLSRVVPIPLHYLRRWRRGYNQAAALANTLAKGIERPVELNWLKRQRFAAMHTARSATARQQAIRGAFRLRKGLNLAGLNILLVDDVMTTGATCDAAARTLKAGGAASVHVAVLARQSLLPGRRLW